MKKLLLSNPGLYHYLRQALTGGMPFDRWVNLYGFTDGVERIADLGCGPADILRYLRGRRLPGFYLGIDISDRYLRAAERKAGRVGLSAEFLRLDLDRLPHDGNLQSEVADALRKHRITRVLLLGVLHHIGDDAARATLELAHEAPTVRSLVTSDVVYLPGHHLNNLLCNWDRGEHVRDEDAYDSLAESSPWFSHAKSFTEPRFSFIRYIHYCLSKQGDHRPDEIGTAEVGHRN